MSRSRCSPGCYDCISPALDEAGATLPPNQSSSTNNSSISESGRIRFKADCARHCDRAGMRAMHDF